MTQNISCLLRDLWTMKDQVKLRSVNPVNGRVIAINLKNLITNLRHSYSKIVYICINIYVCIHIYVYIDKQIPYMCVSYIFTFYNQLSCQCILHIGHNILLSLGSHPRATYFSENQHLLKVDLTMAEKLEMAFFLPSVSLTPVSGS